MTSAAIDLSHVSKTYGRKVRALRDIAMHVARGEIFGLLGPNGAGKSTLVKILMTVIRPSRADGTMLGGRIGDKSVLRRVGYLPEHHRFPEYLTGRQVIEFYGAMAEVPRRERRRRSVELLELVGMKEWGDTKVKGYSKGMRQRVGIAQALVNDPELVVLDEPTDGVDPVGRRDIRAILSRLREQGRTVFLNSHLLSELEMVCDRVAILVHRGRGRRPGRCRCRNTESRRVAGGEAGGRHDHGLDHPGARGSAVHRRAARGGRGDPGGPPGEAVPRGPVHAGGDRSDHGQDAGARRGKG
ncbi:MAG: ABC transporter ATP-binding protein [Phycisphaerales bacterium]|nr:ABC transporter ATP-binding protein [Phycisphaerales bacterium]